MTLSKSRAWQVKSRALFRPRSRAGPSRPARFWTSARWQNDSACRGPRSGSAAATGRPESCQDCSASRSIRLSPSIPQLRETLELLAELEAIAAKFAARRMDDSQRAELRALARSCEQASAADDGKQFGKANAAFHELIYDASRNEYLSEQIKSMRRLMQRYRPKIFGSRHSASACWASTRRWSTPFCAATKPRRRKPCCITPHWHHGLLGVPRCPPATGGETASGMAAATTTAAAERPRARRGRKPANPVVEA